MELRHLRYFIAVAEEENVTRAAARLRLSQPPLTRQIHDLEEELGVALFERKGKSIHLTEAGKVFLEQAKASLQRVEEAVEAVRNTASGQQGDLHIGYAPSPSVEILPKMLEAFQKRFPKVRIILHDHSAPEMLAGLRDRRLQAAILLQPSRRAAGNVTFEPLRTYPIGILTGRSHHLARRRAVTREQVLAEPIIAFSRKEYPDYYDFLERILGRGMKKLRIAEECDSGPSLMAAVGAGRGIAISASVVAIAAGKRLRFVPLTPPPVRAVTGIAYQSDRLTPLGRAFVETATQFRSTKT